MARPLLPYYSGPVTLAIGILDDGNLGFVAVKHDIEIVPVYLPLPEVLALELDLQ